MRLHYWRSAEPLIAWCRTSFTFSISQSPVMMLCGACWALVRPSDTPGLVKSPALGENQCSRAAADRVAATLASVLTGEHWLVSREVRLVAGLLYSGLTTGAGLQTLGEEYCDIIQAAGGVVSLPAVCAVFHASLQSHLCTL